MIKKLDFPESEKQYHIASCGPRVMKPIINFYTGLDVPERELINIANTSRKGTPLESMAKITDNFNLKYTFKTYSTILDITNSIDNCNPVILLIQAWPSKKVNDWSTTWAYGHYIAAFGYDKRQDKLFYFDPYDGKKKYISYEKLDERWHDIDFKKNIVYDHFAIFFKN